MPTNGRYSNFKQRFVCALAICLAALCAATPAAAQKTAKPVLHGKHWVAVTGKPLAASAGGIIFARGGNAAVPIVKVDPRSCVLFSRHVSLSPVAAQRHRQLVPRRFPPSRPELDRGPTPRLRRSDMHADSMMMQTIGPGPLRTGHAKGPLQSPGTGHPAHSENAGVDQSVCASARR